MKKALLISCFNWYKARLEPVREILIEKGFDVTVLIADFDHIQKKPIEKKYEECTYVQVPPYSSNLSLQRIQSHLAFGKEVKKTLERLNPELVYVQIPPNNAAKHCAEYKKKNQDTRLILDIIDLWPESMPLGRLKDTLPAKKWKKWRDDCTEAADHIYTECRLFQEKLQLPKEKTSVLYLFKDQKQDESESVKRLIQQKAEKREKEEIKFAYLGSMNNIIDIKGICDIIKQYIQKGYACELHAIGDGENKGEFEDSAENIGCDSFFYGPIYNEKEKIRILAPCDYALNMMKESVEVGLTIKSVDYMSYGLPMINSIKGDTWDMIERWGIGINVTGKETEAKEIDHEAVHQYFQKNFSRESFEKNLRASLI